MSTTYSIQSPHLFQITDENSTHFHYGADQEWYRKFWQRQAGCGPTTASHLLYYLAQTKSSCSNLVTHDCSQKKGFVQLMEKCWTYVTPGIRGVNSTAMFADGVKRYSLDHNTPLNIETLDVDAKQEMRINKEDLFLFLKNTFSADVPAAFLNLDNGRVKNLDRWHWVTLVACDLRHGTALMYDQGKRSEIDMGLWLETTKLGGGLVTIKPDDTEFKQRT